MKPKLSIVIVNYRSEDVLRHCLLSIQTGTIVPVEVIVVDNQPQPEMAEILRESGLPCFYFPQSDNIGYAAAANFGARHATGEYLCFLNPDIILAGNSLDRLIAFVRQHPRAVVGPREMDVNQRIATSAFPRINRRHLFGVNLLYRISWPVALRPLLAPAIPAFRYSSLTQTATEPANVPVLSGACLLMKRSVWGEVGEWHPALTYFGLESEWFTRADDSGVTAWYIPNAAIIHYHAVSIRRAPRGEVRSEADHNRRWYAAQFGVVTVVILAVVLWFERRLKAGRG